MKATCARSSSLRTLRRLQLLRPQLQGTHTYSLPLINPRLMLRLFALELGLLLKPRHYLPVPHLLRSSHRPRRRRGKETTTTSRFVSPRRKLLLLDYKARPLLRSGRRVMALLRKRCVLFVTMISSLIEFVYAAIGGPTIMR